MADEPTLADLRDRATELDISGRSSMNRDELEAAIRDAEAAAAPNSVAADTSIEQTLEYEPGADGRPPLIEVAEKRAAADAARTKEIS